MAYRYGNSPLSTAPPPAKPDFIDQAWTAWTQGPTNQALIGLEGWVYGGLTKDPNFDPWANMKGYESYAGSLVWAQSPQQMDWMKSQIDFNNAEKAKNTGGAWGFAAQLAGSMLDPINLVPIPITRGMGFVRGGAVGSAANAGIAAVTDPIRIVSDPTADWNELAYSIGGAALFGGALGGLAGGGLPLSRQQFLKGKIDADRFVADLGDLEGANVARDWNAAEENYDVVTGATGFLEDGGYEPVKIDVVESTAREKQGPDGNLYHYDDSLGWVLEADRGSPEPRPVGQDILDALGTPERVQKNRMIVDEAALKKDFEDGKTGLAEGEVRSAREYVTFKQIEAVWKKREPQRPGESKAQWMARIRQNALAEMKGRRASASVARNSAIAQVLDKLNFSPVAKAIRLFKNDNIMGDLPLELAGDYGWSIRANEFGYKTPPSLLLRAMRHTAAFNEIRQATDAAYVKFAQGNAAAVGKSFMGQNLTAAAEGLKARAQSLTGSKVMTKELFSRMAGRAVFDQTDFEIDGVKVPPEAREAAKAWTRVAQKYDREARELGIFYDQRSLERTRMDAAMRAETLRSRMASWLWGATGEPSKLIPAIRVKVKASDFTAPGAGIYDGFHGSKIGFTSFDKDKLGVNTGAASARMGFFFASNVETANHGSYTGADRLTANDNPILNMTKEEQAAYHKELLDGHMTRLEAVKQEADKILVPLGAQFEDRWSIVNGAWDVQDYGDPSGVDPEWVGEALGLTVDPAVIEHRAKVREAFATVEKMLFDFDASEMETWVKFVNVDSILFGDGWGDPWMLDAGKPTGSSVHPVKLVMKNPYVYDQRGQGYRERKYAEIIATAKREGHDSVIIKNTYDPEPHLTDIYVVFDDTQIVSIFDKPRLEETQAMGDREVEQVYTGSSHSDALASAMMGDEMAGQWEEGYITAGLDAADQAPGSKPWEKIPPVPEPTFRVEKRTADTPDPKTFTFDGEGEDTRYFIDGDQVSYGEWHIAKWSQEQGATDYGYFVDGKEVDYTTWNEASKDWQAALQDNLEARYEAGDPSVKLVDHGDEYMTAYHLEDVNAPEHSISLDQQDEMRLRNRRGEAERQAVLERARSKETRRARMAGDFKSSAQLTKGRIDSLSDAQRRVYDDMLDQLDRHEQAKAAAELALTHMEDTPHTFRDQYGEPEPFFARFWNHTQIGLERERFKALLTEWYKRKNPAGAEQQADRTIDAMMKDADATDERPASVPGLRHLAQRKIDMPNSFRASHPKFGEIAASEFFNTDLEVVSEAYLRGMGHKIEAAKMFGDAGLSAKREEIISHFREKYLEPALKKGASAQEIQKLLARRDEYLGWIDLINRGVMGGLKTADPWRLDNRTARNLKNFQVLTSMGKVLITSIPEAMRLPMVNGFRTAFGALWDRAFVDYEKIRANVELSRETGELFDLVRDVHAARVAELNTPDPSGGGTAIERLLQKSVPSYFKLVGLTHWTVIAKDMLMFGAQHKVMDLAKRVNEPGNAAKLASMGISARDARLLASMPVEKHGHLILPAVQNWVGPDAPRARQLLVDAIHGEARRAIVTPSFADKSLLFSGIFARKGKVVLESDIMAVPLQFMSYGLAASQKVAMSALQGRDQSALMGALAMMMLGTFSNYLKQPQTATMNKSAGEWLLEGYEASGVGAFWFSDLNQMIERYSNNTLGIRPMTGIDPRFGKTTNVGDYVDAAGPSVGTAYDVFAAFLDPELTASNRAQAIRRAVPYNNVLWWGSITRDLATKTSQQFE